LKTKTVTKVRLLILVVIVVFITYETYMHQVKGGGPDGSPSIHALCPYGGLESLYTIFTSGSFIDKIYSGTLVLFVVSIITALIFKRGFCGWLCPLGGLQEFLARIGKKIMGRQLVMPVKLDKVLRYLKYGVLVLTAYLAWKTASMWVSPYDPWAAYGHLGEGIPSVWKEFSVGFILLIITFVGSFFYDRFFCKYLCPMGGFLGLVAKISPFKIKRDAEVCIDCNLCTVLCSMNIDVAKVDTVTSDECINCQECVAVCPKEGALVNTYSFMKTKKRSIKPLYIGLAILVVYFGGIGISELSGSYNLLPEPFTEETVITDVDTLKGYMTISEISAAMKINLEDVYKRMNIPENIPANTAMKELSELIPGFDFHDAREALKD
jgi:ferredoxin